MTRSAGTGRPPAFATPLRVGTPNIGDRERFLARLNGALDRGWLSNGGPLTAEFEQRIAEQSGTRHAVATCNATAALQLALRAAGLTGEVIVPALTFAATAHAVSWIGLTPVFCDVDPRTGQLDPAHAETLIGPGTSGILAVHLWGRAAPVERLEKLAAAHGLALFFDAAHAYACTHAGEPVGRAGNGEVFSFHSTKFVNAFEGGALVTDDDALAERAVRMRNFGIAGEDVVEHIGINAKMSEAAAAMGLTSLDSLDRFVARNLANLRCYERGLARVPGLRLLPFPEGERNNYQYVILEVDETVAGIDRDELLAVLKRDNVLARKYFHPACHWMTPYRGPVRLPHAEALSARVLALPTGTQVGEAGIREVCRIIRAAVPAWPAE
ncbi:aminotransferase class I/II-fold pyridoxal phosphate-dependent enzyme [Streptomyces sp. NPDC020742]|uniref:aminotransferase class I/II-fold pyridoxal phosphate-dependent enzyme n=1 Tax=Streptomyces sp. NPDC020742 TaxID=3154897 RepID=UPI00340AA47B